MSTQANIGNGRMGPSRSARGFSLIEVLLAVVILSVGLLALASLQASLTRGVALAKAQSVAISLAEDKIETLRNFSNATGYTSMAGTTETLTPTSGGVTYTRTTAVTRYCATSSSAAYATCTTGSTSESMSDFKKVDVTVTWKGATQLNGGDQTIMMSDIVGDVQPSDTGHITTDVSLTRPNPQVRIFQPSETGIIPIAYGDNDTQASASSNPKPVQEAAGSGATITRFNVQTYVTESGQNPLLQRRQEFAVLSCQCETKNTSAANTSSNTLIAYEPSYFDGTAYTEPRQINGKRVSRGRDLVNNSQDKDQFDLLCDRCCIDHHDTPATGATLKDSTTVAGSVAQRTATEAASSTPPPYRFDPWRPAVDYTSGGDHKHYARTDNSLRIFANSQGGGPAFSEVDTTTNGSIYLDTCRFIRVNGVNYVTVDTRLENMITIRTTPVRSTSDSTNVLLNTTDVANYQAFARKYILQAVGNSTNSGDNSIALPTGYPNNPADSNQSNTGLLSNQLYQSDGTTLSTLATSYNSSSDSSGTSSNNLLNMQNSRKVAVSTLGNYYDVHMRGIYIDFVSREAQNAVACIGQTSDPACVDFATKALLDLVPFYAINLTNLTYWTKPANTTASIECDDQSYDVNCNNISRYLYSMSNGFPQTYGATYTRANSRAKDNGVANIQGFSYRGNSSLTDQYAIDSNDADQYPSSGITVAHKEFATDNEAIITGTGSASVTPPAATTFKVNLLCYERAQNGSYSACANNSYWGSQIASIVLTFKTNASPSAGENPNPTTPPPTVCAAANGNDASERVCDFESTTGVSSISFAIKSYNRCTQDSSNGQNATLLDACKTTGSSKVANYNLCGVNRSVTPATAFGYTSSGAATASPYTYLYGNTFSNDVSKEVSWLKLTQSSGSTMESTLPTYSKTVATGGSNGALQIVFVESTSDSAPYDAATACPTVLSTL